MNKKIIITGGTGFLGQYLTSYFLKKGFEIVILSRGQHKNRVGVRYYEWDGKTIGNWAKEFENAVAVINLAGKSVNCRYTETNKRIILESRVNATTVVGEAIQQAKNPPKVWLNGGSATIYRYSEEMDMTETGGELGEGFSVEVCKAWEKTFNSIKTPQTRKIFKRISIVLGDDGGVIGHLKWLVRFGLGGTQGHGRQFVSWIHIDDYARITEFLLEKEHISGIVNCVSPRPVTNQLFMKTLRQVYGIPFGLPLPKWILEIGAILIGTDTELILKSRKVVPKRLLEEGFEFRYHKLEDAFRAT